MNINNQIKLNIRDSHFLEAKCPSRKCPRKDQLYTLTSK